MECNLGTTRPYSQYSLHGARKAYTTKRHRLTVWALSVMYVSRFTNRFLMQLGTICHPRRAAMMALVTSTMSVRVLTALCHSLQWHLPN